MKKILLLLLICAISFSYAQEKNKIIQDEKTKKNMFVGYGDRTVFADTSFSTWYKAEYEVYKLDNKVIEKITPDKLENVKITIICGTWCGDTKREVPRFLKILDAVKFSGKNLNLIFVNREKKNPYGDIEEYKIKFVPTIIISRGEKELGRIIEVPKETLEKDFLGMVK